MSRARDDDLASDDVDWDAVRDNMPLGLAVVAADGTIRAINEQGLTMLGRHRSDVVGRSVLELAAPEDLEFGADVLADGVRFGGRITGPVSIRFVDAQGDRHATRIWSRNCLDRPGIDGYVVTFSAPSTLDRLNEAVQLAVTRADLDDSLGAVVAAFEGRPFLARASILLPDGDDLRVVGHWPLRDVEPRGEAAPWAAALGGDEVHLTDVESLPTHLVEAARDAGVHAVWARPITPAEGPTAALVAWRRTPGHPSPNQDLQMGTAATVAALALDQHAHRLSVDRALQTDPLTGLGNRARLDRMVRDTARETTDEVTILYVDLDEFKDVNDRHGHHVGDLVLAEIGLRFNRAVRVGDEVIRVGGDEFVIVCSPPRESVDLENLAVRVIEALSQPLVVGDLTIQLSASIGIVDRAPRPDLSTAIRRADAAMYQAKADGRGTWRRAD